MEIEDPLGMRALHYAAETGEADAVHLLISAGADKNAQDKLGRAPIHCAKERVESVLIYLGCNVTIQDNFGQTPLHLAAKKDDAEMVAMLLNHSADIRLTNIEGCTCIHVAAFQGNANALKVLLTKNAWPSIVEETNNFGLTALQIAASFNHFEVFKLLVTIGKANINYQTNSNTKTALHFAVEEDNLEMAKFLVDSGASLSLPDADGDSPLHMAIMCRETNVESVTTSIACLLASNGADLTLKNHTGRTPLQLCRDPEFRKMLEKCSTNSGVDGASSSRLVAATAQLSLHEPSAPPAPLSNDLSNVASAPEAPILQQLEEIREQMSCPICFERNKNMVFLCGHSTCHICGDQISSCPICRVRIDKRIKLY